MLLKSFFQQACTAKEVSELHLKKITNLLHQDSSDRLKKEKTESLIQTASSSVGIHELSLKFEIKQSID
ncbi:hypothetical protein AOC36_06495 [Erysipelothrix larvae]|uniref:Uncharacterized protein n=1 Tax=Erysipelothrix larvae TaxID=1514105 RepID=A0A120JTQ6_9FIRM|nr:hypothetical protein AOC36_06495 [Erysipelothrix larvae]